MDTINEEKDGKFIVNPEKLSEDEQIALEVYENLKEAYRLTAVEKVMDSNYLEGPKKFLDGVMEKYSPEKETINMQPQEEYAVAA